MHCHVVERAFLDLKSVRLFLACRDIADVIFTCRMERKNPLSHVTLPREPSTYQHIGHAVVAGATTACNDEDVAAKRRHVLQRRDGFSGCHREHGKRREVPQSCHPNLQNGSRIT